MIQNARYAHYRLYACTHNTHNLALHKWQAKKKKEKNITTSDSLEECAFSSTGLRCCWWCFSLTDWHHHGDSGRMATLRIHTCMRSRSHSEPYHEQPISIHAFPSIAWFIVPWYYMVSLLIRHNPRRSFLVCRMRLPRFPTTFQTCLGCRVCTLEYPGNLAGYQV